MPQNQSLKADASLILSPSGRLNYTLFVMVLRQLAYCQLNTNDYSPDSYRELPFLASLCVQCDVSWFKRPLGPKITSSIHACKVILIAITHTCQPFEAKSFPSF